MKVVIQRVSQASVTVNGGVPRRIGPGMVILIGISGQDTPDIATFMADKAAHLRIFNDEKGDLNRSLLDIRGSCLAVSNFTLYANSRKGRRPSFLAAGNPDVAKPLYEQFVTAVKETGVRQVVTGEFGADMQVELVNDGPVTILLDSEEIIPKIRK